MCTRIKHCHCEILVWNVLCNKNSILIDHKSPTVYECFRVFNVEAFSCHLRARNCHCRTCNVVANNVVRPSGALGPVSISDKTYYRKISWSFEAARFVVWIIASQWCRGACQSSERSDNIKHQSRGLRTSRDRVIRRFIGYFGYWNRILVTAKWGMVLVGKSFLRSSELTINDA